MSILLFNLTGYRWLFYIVEQKATASLEDKISAGTYSEDQLFEIKIPLNMPYYSDMDYQVAYGETEWNGRHYRYVKRKVQDNVLYLLCLPHEQKDRIVNAQQDFIKMVNDVSSGNSQDNQSGFFSKLIWTEYLQDENPTAKNTLIPENSWNITDSYMPGLFDPLTSEQPPDLTQLG